MKVPLKETPAQLGFSMPAEWTRHEATWLVWPKNPITWPDDMMERVRSSYRQVIESLIPFEKVKLLVDDEKTADSVRSLFLKNKHSANLCIIVKPTVDSWIRDFGPTYVTSKDGGKAWCKWIFNAWGGKYDDLMQDTCVFEDISLAGGRCFDTGLILEGGSIEVNGDGTCLTTEQCLLNANRNPQYSKEEIENLLKAYLGVNQIVWLKEGVAGDDTDGHIDDIARFVSKDTIVIVQDKPGGLNEQVMKENLEILQASRCPDGSAWKIVTLPMPEPVMAEGEPLPASYANFYIANEVVLLPVFDDPMDEQALKILQELFPTREVIPVPCRDVVYGMGTLHCLSQQEPSV